MRGYGAWLGAWLGGDIMGFNAAISSIGSVSPFVRGYSSWDDFLGGVTGQGGEGAAGAAGQGVANLTDYAAPGLLDQLGLGTKDDVVAAPPPPATTTPTGQVVTTTAAPVAAAGIGAVGLLAIGVVAYLAMAGGKN